MNINICIQRARYTCVYIYIYIYAHSTYERTNHNIQHGSIRATKVASVTYHVRTKRGGPSLFPNPQITVYNSLASHAASLWGGKLLLTNP